jgi:copper homeostasis protein
MRRSQESMAGTLLEICCGSLDDALEAERGGADRVELCSALFLGGLTPSAGTIKEAKGRLKIPLIAMDRPRSGGFCYTPAEMAVMERDAEFAISQGADGVVFDILNPDGTVDLERSARLRKLIGNRQAVFHRAFDVTPDPFKALDQLVDLGITRVLTSGQEDTAPEGLDLIKRLVEYAADRIQVMPGGGIKPHNLRCVIDVTRCKQVHLAALKTAYDTSTRGRPLVTFGGALYPPEDQYQVAERSLIEQYAQTVKS